MEHKDHIEEKIRSKLIREELETLLSAFEYENGISNYNNCDCEGMTVYIKIDKMTIAVDVSVNNNQYETMPTTNNDYIVLSEGFCISKYDIDDIINNLVQDWHGHPYELKCVSCKGDIECDEHGIYDCSAYRCPVDWCEYCNMPFHHLDCMGNINKVEGIIICKNCEPKKPKHSRNR